MHFRKQSAQWTDDICELGAWARVEIPVRSAPTIRLDLHNLLNSQVGCGTSTQLPFDASANCGATHDFDGTALAPRTVTVTLQVDSTRHR